MWTEEQKQKNAKAIIGQNIDRDSLGRKLTPEARERAIDFGVKTWKGNIGSGDAARTGIRHVTSDTFKES